MFANGKEVFNDFGYRIFCGEKGTAVTNWVDPAYVIKYKDHKASVEGCFNLIKSQMPTPLKHMGLRVLSFFLGNRLIGFLKKQLIFINKHLEVNFKREIIFGEEKIQIVDKIRSSKEVNIKSANSLSLRHVASGKFFKFSELVNRPVINLTDVREVEIRKEFRQGKIGDVVVKYDL